MDIISLLALPVICGIISNYIFNYLQDTRRGPALVLVGVLSALALALAYLPDPQGQLSSLLTKLPGFPVISLSGVASVAGPASPASSGAPEASMAGLGMEMPLALLAGIQGYLAGILISLITMVLMVATVPRTQIPGTLRIVLVVLVAVIVFARKDIHVDQTIVTHQMLLIGCTPAAIIALAAGWFAPLFARKTWVKLTAMSYFMLLMTTAMMLATL